jgi:hypothetical protein
MKIGNAKYCKGVGSFEDTNTSITCTIDGQVWNVPLDPYNSHYAAILEWVADGNTIEEAD